MKTAVLAWSTLVGRGVTRGAGEFHSPLPLWLAFGLALLGGPAAAAKAAEPGCPGHLLNISTRARVGSGDDVVVCGFVISGESSRRVLVRVLGPSLRQFGIADAVADPVMQVIPVGATAAIATNDNWREPDPAAVLATGLAPYDPLDCALVLTLSPGSYTATISGRNSGTGVALVEVYDLDEPSVVATEPRQNAPSVSGTTSSVSFTFDRPMATETDVDPGAAWGTSSGVWSADRRQLTLTRVSAATPLASLTRVGITLNPASGSRRMRDGAGNTLATYTLAFTVGAPAGTPHVVATSPAAGAVVPPATDKLTFTFSEPMGRTAGGSSSGWYPYAADWSPDMKTLTLTRTWTAPLSSGSTIWFRLPAGVYRSAPGVPMAADYELSFSVALNIQRVEADPARGFHWPYYLLISANVAAPATLLVEPNNTGTVDNNPARHELAAESLIRNQAWFASGIGSPLLVPAFPRPINPPAPEPGGIYTHALDRFCLQMNGCPIERLDRQLLAMVDDARARLAAAGVNAGSRFFMTGFSASGAFTSRFALLHPDRIQAAACGSPGGWPIAPVAAWNGVVLRYPCGMSDVAAITGEQPNVAAFARLPLFIYVGSVDTNDALDTRAMSASEKLAINTLLRFPQDPYIANRWPIAEAIYRSVGSAATFRVYPDVGHAYSSAMWADLTTFFNAHR